MSFDLRRQAGFLPASKHGMSDSGGSYNGKLVVDCEFPQRLKPNVIVRSYGTTEVMPFPFSLGLGIPNRTAQGQQANWSRVIFRPGRFPRTVTATDSVLKNSFAKFVRSSAVTASIFSISSSRS